MLQAYTEVASPFLFCGSSGSEETVCQEKLVSNLNVSELKLQYLQKPSLNQCHQQCTTLPFRTFLSA